MNSSIPFDASIDNDNPNEEVIKTLDSAAQNGWKVKLVYHETMGFNWFGNRGETTLIDSESNKWNWDEQHKNAKVSFKKLFNYLK